MAVSSLVVLSPRFVELLSGSSITIVVGEGLPFARPQGYSLPCKLLAYNSKFLRDEIDKRMQLLVQINNEQETQHMRPRNPTPENDNEAKKVAARAPIIIPYFKPFVFGLFLHFIYQGTYPFNMANSIPFGPGSSANSFEVRSVPLHFRAWILGETLSAPAFQNNAIEHVFHAAGKQYSLTPHLVGWLWEHTKQFTTCGTPSHTSNSDNENSSDTNSRHTPGFRECKLRTLTLDLLISNWSIDNNIVSRQPQLENAWNDLFNAQESLREDLIFGLMKSRRTLALNCYFIEGETGYEPRAVRKRSHESCPVAAQPRANAHNPSARQGSSSNYAVGGAEVPSKSAVADGGGGKTATTTTTNRAANSPSTTPTIRATVSPIPPSSIPPAHQSPPANGPPSVAPSPIQTRIRYPKFPTAPSPHRHSSPSSPTVSPHPRGHPQLQPKPRLDEPSAPKPASKQLQNPRKRTSPSFSPTASSTTMPFVSQKQPQPSGVKHPRLESSGNADVMRDPELVLSSEARGEMGNREKEVSQSEPRRQG